jgi:hypothetical protein
MPLKLLFKLTTRSRYARAIEALDSIYNNLVNKEDFHVIVSMDVDDLEMAKPEVVEVLNKYKNLTHYYGISYSKVNAINRDVSLAPEYDVLVNWSDDQYATCFGFDDIIREAMQNNFPDTDGVTHFPDTITGDLLITLSIIGKKYMDRFNYIYHPSYISLFCDNEFGDVAKKLGKYVFIDKSIYIHKHPAFGLVPTDEQYIHTESFYSQDGANYQERKSNNFYL